MTIKSILVAGSAALALIAGPLAVSAASAAEVSVTLTGVKEGGAVYVALQTEDMFMGEDGIAGEIVQNVDAGDITVTLDAPAGTYALQVWHDIDGNGEFDLAPQGWPKDGWAAVNGTKLMGPPTWDQVSFDLPEDGTSLSEQMIYPEFYEAMMGM